MPGVATDEGRRNAPGIPELHKGPLEREERRLGVLGVVQQDWARLGADIWGRYRRCRYPRGVLLGFLAAP